MTTDKAKGRAKIKSLPFTQNGKFHSGQEIPGTYDSGTGVMEWLFPWGARVEFTIPNILQKVETVTIPSVGVSNLEDLVS